MERAWKKKWRQRILSTVLCVGMAAQSLSGSCLLYTSDAADD